jgi:hypothetical protein
MEQLIASIRRLEALIYNDRAERNVNQERMDANIRGIIEDIRACRKRRRPAKK